MKAAELLRRRIVYSEHAFADLGLWRVPELLAESTHGFKYCLGYVVNGVCVLRFDNETGKGVHRHYGGTERRYIFSTPEKLIAEFQRDIARWNDENSHA